MVKKTPLMQRAESIGAGIGQLDKKLDELRQLCDTGEADDKILDELHEEKRDEKTPRQDAPIRRPSKKSGILVPTSPTVRRGGLSLWDFVTAVLVLAMSSLVALVVHPPTTWAMCENSCAKAFDGTCDDGGVEGWPFEAQKAGGGGS